MRKLAQTISWLAILGTILPSALYLFNGVSLELCQWAMLLATIVWFVVTPFWMGRDTKAATAETANPI